MDDGKNVGGILLAFLAGSVVGGALALIFAPASGVETRQRIKATSLDAKGKTLGKVDAVRSEASQLVERSKEKVAGVRSQIQAAVGAGKEAYTQKKDELMPEEAEE